MMGVVGAFVCFIPAVFITVKLLSPGATEAKPEKPL